MTWEYPDSPGQIVPFYEQMIDVYLIFGRSDDPTPGLQGHAIFICGSFCRGMSPIFNINSITPFSASHLPVTCALLQSLSQGENVNVCL